MVPMSPFAGQEQRHSTVNRLVDAAGERESGTNGDSGTDTYTTTGTTDSQRGAADDTGSSAGHFAMTQRGGMVGEDQEGGDTCVLTADSC